VVDFRRQHAGDWLVRELRRALRNLYDPDELRKSPLTPLLCVAEPERPSALQRVLTGAIQALEPDHSLSAQSNAWRTYYTLSSRYIQQFRQHEVAAGLGLSLRQMRRQESLALRVLAEYLCTQYGLDPGAGVASPRSQSAAAPAGDASPDGYGREQELEWLGRTVAAEPVPLAEMVEGLLATVAPLAQAVGVEVQCAVPADLPRPVAQPSILRQALLNVLTAAIRSVPSGQVRVAAEAQAHEVCVRIQSISRHTPLRATVEDQTESIAMARRLVGMAGGSLETAPGPGAACATFRLPAAEQPVVLVIDDNVDALQLYQRYLAGSRYGFAGARDPEQALALAERLAPRAILLDIMLPGVDGWELLGRLREHPRLSGVPILVCTILPQEPLALTLGAAAFLRKPVSRADLLAALDRHSGLRSRGSTP
jgi:CheY-like chemotaxis protein